MDEREIEMEEEKEWMKERLRWKGRGERVDERET